LVALSVDKATVHALALTTEVSEVSHCIKKVFQYFVINSSFNCPITIKNDKKKRKKNENNEKNDLKRN